MWLKKKTFHNIVIGGAAGCFPPLVGWSAVTGDLSLSAWYLFAIIFFWTPPHFWALAILTSNEYQKASIPMMPNIVGSQSTIKQILFYSVIMSASALLPFYLGMVSVIYLLPVCVLSAMFIGASVQLYKAKTKEKIEIYSKRLFAYSILYLFLVFTFFLIDYLYIKYSWELPI